MFSLDDIEDVHNNIINVEIFTDWDSSECLEIKTLNEKDNIAKLISSIMNNLSTFEKLDIHKYYSINNINDQKVTTVLKNNIELYKKNKIYFTNLTISICYNNILNKKIKKYINYDNSNYLEVMNYYINSWILSFRSFLLSSEKKDELKIDKIITNKFNLDDYFIVLTNDVYGSIYKEIFESIFKIIPRFILLGFKLNVNREKNNKFIRSNILLSEQVDYYMVIIIILLYYNGVYKYNYPKLFNSTSTNYILSKIELFNKYLLSFSKIDIYEYLDKHRIYYNIFYVIILKYIKYKYKKLNIIKIILNNL